MAWISPRSRRGCWRKKISLMKEAQYAKNKRRSAKFWFGRRENAVKLVEDWDLSSQTKSKSNLSSKSSQIFTNVKGSLTEVMVRMKRLSRQSIRDLSLITPNQWLWRSEDHSSKHRSTSAHRILLLITCQQGLFENELRIKLESTKSKSKEI